MTPERWKRVAALFTAIAEQPETAWSELLDQFCGSEDSPDRIEVERLLRAEIQGTNFLDRSASPISEGLPTIGISTDHPTRVGNYRLLHPIGQGAVGVVYLAVRDDDAYQQRVAIKLIRPGIEDPSAIRRFLAERQILAGLEHPNIARLYGGGDTADGRPYLAMEYVEGLPITTYCDRRRLSIEARLRLFLNVCSAVQHAHQSLLVHRDIKPGNILVTTDGTVKLLDFGIAKLLAPREGIDPRTTQTGLRPMTPGYASPEQIQGAPITTATDVYSLGVLLFELLTGKRPYRVSTVLPHELEQAICEGEARRPSSTFVLSDGESQILRLHRASTRSASPGELRRNMRGDLDTIVARALRKEPNRRYPSALQLAEDIDRHLANRPIHARQDHLGYRMGKFGRRHRTALTVAGIAFFVISVLGMVVHRQAGVIESSRFGSDRLTELFAERRSSEDSSADSAHSIPREALDSSLTELAPRLGGDRQAFAEMLETMGWIYRRAGLIADARWLFEQSIDQRQHTDDDESLAGGRYALGALLVGTGDLTAGEAELRRAMALHQGVDESGTYALAEAQETLGKHLWAMGELDEAELLLTESLTVKRRLCPQAAWTARGMSDLAWLFLAQQRLDEAKPLLNEAAGLRERLSLTHRETPRTTEDQALLAFAQGDLEQSQSLFAQATEARRDRFGPYQPEILTDLVWQARALISLERSGQAVPILRQAMSIHRNLDLGDTPQLATVLKHLGRGLTATGESEAAETLFHQVIDLETRWLPADHPHVALSRLWLGQVLHKRGDLAGAEALYRRAASDLANRPEWEFGLGIEPQIALARLHLELGNWIEAESSLKASLELAAATHPTGHWRLNEAINMLSTALTQQRHFGEFAADGSAPTLIASSS